LAFPPQKLLTHEAAMFPIIARSGEKLAIEEQRDYSAAVKTLGDDKDVVRR
jgi:hypothetical protein